MKQLLPVLANALFWAGVGYVVGSAWPFTNHFISPVLQLDSGWQYSSWLYSPHNHDCATVTRQPEHYYQVVLLGEDGQPLLTELFQFDSDREMEKFVEGVCAKR